MTEHHALEQAGKSDDPIADFPYQLVQIALAPEDRAVLHQRIEQRFIAMCESGFEEEVRDLMARGDLHLDMPSMRCVGYRQMWQYLEGQYSREDMIYKGVVATRQLAKRQLTWLRGWQGLNWIYTTYGQQEFDKQVLVDYMLQEAVKITNQHLTA